MTEEQVPLSYNKVSADDLIAVSKTMPDRMCKEIELKRTIAQMDTIVLNEGYNLQVFYQNFLQIVILVKNID